MKNEKLLEMPMDNKLEKKTISQSKLSEDEEASLCEALRYLELASTQLKEARQWERMRAWYRHFLGTFAIFRNLFFLILLTLLWVWFGFRLKEAFSLAVLCIMVPLLALVWRTRGDAELGGFLVDIHCSDEVIMEMGAHHLLEWDTSHPEVGLEEEASLSDLCEWVEKRKLQLEQELECSLKQMESESARHDE